MNTRLLLTPGTALAAALAFLSMTPVRGEDGVTTPTNPGPIHVNPAVAPHPTSQSSYVSNMPTPEEARAALMTPVSKQPSAGEASAATTGVGALGNQTSPVTGGAETTNGPLPSGPIGSFGQTIPAKFSERNDVLDHVPTMAMPLPLADDQLKRIYDAVMADPSPPGTGTDALKPASELSPEQALTEMHPLPESVRGIEGVSRLYYIKAPKKVLLVEPDVRTVVDQISAK